MNSEPKDFQQVQKLANLEARLNSLEKSLRQSQSSNNQAIPVVGNSEAPKIKHLKISPEKLREIYHEVPQVLSAYANRVSLTADSYRKKTLGEIYLEKQSIGNYWIIATETEDKEQYYLFPYGNLTINLYGLKTLEYLFQFQEPSAAQTNNFTVVQAAIVSLLPNNQKWKLEKKGELDFINPYYSSDWQAQICELESNYSQLKSQIEDISQVNHQLQLEIKRMSSQLQDANTERQQISSQIENISQISSLLLSQISDLPNNLSNKISSLGNLGKQFIDKLQK